MNIYHRFLTPFSSLFFSFLLDGVGSGLVWSGRLSLGSIHIVLLVVLVVAFVHGRHEEDLEGGKRGIIRYGNGIGSLYGE